MNVRLALAAPLTRVRRFSQRSRRGALWRAVGPWRTSSMSSLSAALSARLPAHSSGGGGARWQSHASSGVQVNSSSPLRMISISFVNWDIESGVMRDGNE